MFFDVLKDGNGVGTSNLVQRWTKINNLHFYYIIHVVTFLTWIEPNSVMVVLVDFFNQKQSITLTMCTKVPAVPVGFD